MEKARMLGRREAVASERSQTPTHRAPLSIPRDTRRAKRKTEWPEEQCGWWRLRRATSPQDADEPPRLVVLTVP
jgi:hypothetical protein